MLSHEILKEAREWIGTKFHHQARKKGISCDCVGLLIGVCKKLGINTRNGMPIDSLDRLDYSPMSHANDLEKTLTDNFYKLSINSIASGDLGLFNIAGYNQHIGFFADMRYSTSTLHTIIHADQVKGEVCEHVLDSKWRRRLVSAFRIYNDITDL